MRSRKRIIITVLICFAVAALAYYAWKFPFYEFDSNSYDTDSVKLFSLEYLKTLVPLFIIIGLSALGIVLIIWLRKLMLKTDKNYSRFAQGKKRCAVFFARWGLFRILWTRYAERPRPREFWLTKSCTVR